MLRSFAAVAMLFLLSGCSEINYASHLVKEVLPGHSSDEASYYGTRPPPQGTFKVGSPYRVDGQWYYPREQYNLVETGLASWYGPGFDGHRTASGEIYHSNELTAAHRTLQMPSLVRVTNLDNGRSIVVRVNDRGPFRRGRVMDVSSRAADLLGMKGAGTAKVRLQVLTEESMRLTELAKSGVNTRGYEMAMMKGQERTPVIQGPYEVASVEPVSQQPLPPVVPVPGHMSQGTFYPDPVVTHEQVTPANIYVQAGAFTVEDNAERLRDELRGYRSTRVIQAVINGQQYYRVRLGPVASVDEADRLLDRVVRDGHDKAIIVVE
jgi:rare lipoprotein A